MKHSKWRERIDQARKQLVDGLSSPAVGSMERLRRKMLVQDPYELQHDTHFAEVLWLKGLLLIHAGRVGEASTTYRQLATPHLKRMRVMPDAWLLPGCEACATADHLEPLSWWNHANQLRPEVDALETGREVEGLVAVFVRTAEHLVAPAVKTKDGHRAVEQ